MEQRSIYSVLPSNILKTDKQTDPNVCIVKVFTSYSSCRDTEIFSTVITLLPEELCPIKAWSNYGSVHQCARFSLIQNKPFSQLFFLCTFFQVSMTVLDSAEMEEHAQTWQMTTSAAVQEASQARIVRPTLMIVRVIPV